MLQNDYLELLKKAEDECIEFKEVKGGNFDIDKLARYFSALSNEARLNSKESAWLIFGVTDNKKIVGTKYKDTAPSLQKVKQDMSQRIDNGLTFLRIEELNIDGNRVLFFEIPPAHINSPTSYNGAFYGRNGESVSPLSTLELNKLLNQHFNDWSKEIIEELTINDLDVEALRVARSNYKAKNPRIIDEIETWTDIEFLNKAKITIKGKITKTTVLLLGKSESAINLSPNPAKISWILKNERGIEEDYEHFSPPYLLTAEMAFHKIRNLNYRYMQDNTLFPTEIKKYDPYVIREVLNNCIAHQDYRLNGKINIVEFPNKLIFSNLGLFLPGTVENVISQEGPQERYRNPFLAEAMVNLNMIDTIGSGIRKMIDTQIKRYFPLPEFDFTKAPDGAPRVQVTIIGEVLDINYTKLLVNNTNLSIEEIMLLDKLQKGQRISKVDADYLRSKKLIEGRYPNVYVPSNIAEVTNTRGKYLDRVGFNNMHYKELILEYLRKFQPASKSQLYTDISDKFPSYLTVEQKNKKLDNLLNNLSKKENKIESIGYGKKATWKLKN